MNHVTIIWSVVAACALLLAAIYALVWLMDRRAHASLAFACAALGLVGIVVVELGLMHSASAAEWGEWARWAQIPVLLYVAGSVAFIRLYFGTGRLWLLWTIIGLRVAIMVTGFAVDPNFHFARIDSIERIAFLGEQVTIVGAAVLSPWQWVGTFANLFVPMFLADASIQLWRTGVRDARRIAAVVGGAAFVSQVMGSVSAQLTILAGVHLPLLMSPPGMFVLMVMAFELSRGTLRAGRLARELRESEARLQVAAAAAGLGLWSWDSGDREFWATPRARGMLGVGDDDTTVIAWVRSRVHPDDLPQIESALRHSASGDTEAQVQFRIGARDGSTRWLIARGRLERDGEGRLVSVQGVLRDVTETLRTREEIDELRRNLAHAGRVSVVGTLSSSLTHELSQPLGAILLNAEAAALLLNAASPDLQQVRQILADIVRNDRRAADVLDGLRRLLKRGQMDSAQVSVESLIQDVAMLLRSDAIVRGVRLECESDPGLPPLRGDRVHLSQVLLNVALNGMDAVASQPPARRWVRVHASSDGKGTVELTVRDAGPGIEPALMTQVFEPFFTTKSSGMGLGLSVSRTIVDAHGGKIWVENAPEGGAIFRIELPA